MRTGSKNIVANVTTPVANEWSDAAREASKRAREASKKVGVPARAPSQMKEGETMADVHGSMALYHTKKAGEAVADGKHDVAGLHRSAARAHEKAAAAHKAG